jgi:hypothetical protein
MAVRRGSPTLHIVIFSTEFAGFHADSVPASSVAILNFQPAAIPALNLHTVLRRMATAFRVGKATLQHKAAFLRKTRIPNSGQFPVPKT